MSKALLWKDIDYATAEEIYIQAKKWAEKDDVWDHTSKAQMGMRIARARDHKFMLALEQITEVLEKVEEEQNGRTRRDASTPFALRHKPAVVQAYVKAYEAACEGQPNEAFAYLYAAIAHYAGYF